MAEIFLMQEVPQSVEDVLERCGSTQISGVTEQGRGSCTMWVSEGQQGKTIPSL